MAKAEPPWRKTPERSDYEAALSYLSLIYPTRRARKLVSSLRRAKTVTHAAKDLLRASNLPLLPRDEPQVDHDLQRIHKGKSLAPILLVQGDMSKGLPLNVADGYHRICAICYYDEDAPVACKIVPV
jgi:hypothetical protein